MHTIRNIEAYQEQINAGHRAFAEGQGIHDNPEPDGERAKAWEIGWLNEQLLWLHIMAGIENKAGGLIQARIAELTTSREYGHAIGTHV